MKSKERRAPDTGAPVKNKPSLSPIPRCSGALLARLLLRHTMRRIRHVVWRSGGVLRYS